MTNMIIKIHGASGAGKTTAVRSLFEHAMSTGILHGPKGKIEAYNLVLPGVYKHVYVIGSYENHCGGVDTISDYRDVLTLVDHYYRLDGHVVFEGLLQSTYYGAMGEHSRQYGDNYVYAFLDTPKEVCIERVNARRLANDTRTKFNPENTRKKWDTIERLRRKLIGVHNVKMLSHNQPMFPQMLDLMK
jgi:hypothetical protein